MLGPGSKEALPTKHSSNSSSAHASSSSSLSSSSSSLPTKAPQQAQDFVELLQETGSEHFGRVAADILREKNLNASDFLSAVLACRAQGAWRAARDVLSDGFPHEVAMLKNGSQTGKWVPCRVHNTSHLYYLAGSGNQTEGGEGREPMVNITLINGRKGPAKPSFIRKKIWNVTSDAVWQIVKFLQPKKKKSQQQQQQRNKNTTPREGNDEIKGER
mmetsp:Transcript_26472/g.51774  ORF Transcript_26472/g.51774 Transcript_26472/m.51774 type:complete len:216 (+) Transcript_26472:1-648(+)